MAAREDILSALRARRSGTMARPPRYKREIAWPDDVAQFAERAKAEAAEVHVIASPADVPDAVAGVLRAHNMRSLVHLAPGSPLNAMEWTVETSHASPGPNDTAVSIAPFAIAETGTLVFAAGTAAPASWHFRPGHEIAVVMAANILPTLEHVLERMEDMPSTVNLVTGPSRTGDIEQTIELGAHGPKSLSILIVKG